MTISTRRRLILCAVVVALTVPAELILVRAVTLDAQSASAEWANGLSPQALQVAAAQIQNFPPQYRKDIMRRLAPAQRAQVWVDHITAYRDARPELSTEHVDALNAAIAAAAATLGGAEADASSDEQRGTNRIVAERVQELFGKEVADYLLHRLGNRSLRIVASATPWHLTLSDYVRERFVVQAAAAGDCECNVDFGCDGLSLTWCDGAVNCTIDDTWPACGWFWNEPCNGVCKIGSILT